MGRRVGIKGRRYLVGSTFLTYKNRTTGLCKRWLANINIEQFETKRLSQNDTISLAGKTFSIISFGRNCLTRTHWSKMCSNVYFALHIQKISLQNFVERAFKYNLKAKLLTALLGPDVFNKDEW